MDVIKDMLDEELKYLIETSSYRRKFLANTQIEMGRVELEALYRKCREYACNSIVNHLRRLNEMAPSDIYHLDCKKESFFILARVRTNYETGTMQTTAMKRKFLSFSILTEKNLSHFPGRVIYGYYTGVVPSMIGYIYPRDASTSAYAQNRLELSELPEELLDIDDLCTQALLEKTYCQLSIESRHKVGTLLPCAVISIDVPTKDDLLASKRMKLPILVLHRGPKTAMTVRDIFFTPELSNPRYL